MTGSRTAESGSILIWIFLGIALFAALSFAVSDIMRGGGSTDIGEVSRLRATDLLQYAWAVQRGIRTMNIDGIDESELCFHASQWGHTDYEYNPQCADNANRIFSSEGGGISFQDGVDDWYAPGVPALADGDRTWVFSAKFEVGDVGTDSGGGGTVAANADLVMATAPVRNDVCESLNALLGFSDVTPPAVAASTYDDLAAAPFKGVFADDAGRIAALGRERCVADPGGFNLYYKVILAR